MKTIFLILFAMAITSCSPVYYAPNSQNIPMIKEKGQLNIAAGINTTDETAGYEFQAAYGLTKNIALQLNSDFVESGRGKFGEIGVGYYSKSNANFIFEFYGLVAYAKVENNINTSDSFFYSSNESIEANFLRIGIQPSLSYNSKYFNFSISTRIASINYQNIQGYELEANYLKRNDSQFVFEPGITLQSGFQNLKFQLQYVYSSNFTNTTFPQDNNLLSLGLIVNIIPKKNLKLQD